MIKPVRLNLPAQTLRYRQSFLLSFITVCFWFPLSFPYYLSCFLCFFLFLLFSISFVFITHPWLMCDSGSVYVYCTVMSADVPLCTVLDIDLYLVTAEYEAVAEQLHIYSCWRYLLSLFPTERGYQTPGVLM